MPDRSATARSEASPIWLPLIMSLAGHIIGLTLLIFFVTETSPPPPLEKSGIAVVIAPLAAQPQATLTPAQPVQPIAPPPAAATLPPQETVPPLPAPKTPPITDIPVPVVPPEQTVIAETPPPPPAKPALRPKPKFLVRRQEPVQPLFPAAPRHAQAAPPALAAASYATGSSAPRTLAASVPGPDPAVNYRAMISAWLETHKRYPDSARERGEEGSIGLRFRVDRYGRVIGYALLNSSGYADLDQGIAEMMNGAQLPPFPPSMSMSQIDVSVRIGFSLTR